MGVTAPFSWGGTGTHLGHPLVTGHLSSVCSLPPPLAVRWRRYLPMGAKEGHGFASGILQQRKDKSCWQWAKGVPWVVRCRGAHWSRLPDVDISPHLAEICAVTKLGQLTAAPSIRPQRLPKPGPAGSADQRLLWVAGRGTWANAPRAASFPGKRRRPDRVRGSAGGSCSSCRRRSKLAQVQGGGLPA